MTMTKHIKVFVAVEIVKGKYEQDYQLSNSKEHQVNSMSRIFENMKEAINEIERDIMEMGIKVHTKTMQNIDISGNEDFSTMEVQNYSFTILDLSNKDSMTDDMEWCAEEFIERISGSNQNPGEAWKLRRSTWEPFLVEGKMDYTYAERYSYRFLGSVYTQLTQVIEILKADTDSRQAVLHMHFPKDVWRATYRTPVRVPCSMYYQFMIRRGKLDVIYNMRSSDYDTHFINDIWLADELRNYIAEEIGIEPGLFHMNVGSLHRYKNYTTKHVF